MKYWVFDLDGTIVDSFHPYFEFLENYLQEPLTVELKKEYISKHPKVLLERKLSAKHAELAMRDLIDRNIKEISTIPLFHGVNEAIHQLIQNDCRVSVWTSRDIETTQVILNHTGLSSRVDHVVAGDQVLKRKPNPEGILRIQQLYNCASHEMVMVGDHEHDMLAAQSIGVKSVRASWHPHWGHDVCSLATHQFYCHHDFKNWVQKGSPY